GRVAALVRERAKQFGGEDKIRVVCDASQPRAGRLRRRWMIKAAVDFRRVEILRDQCERVEFRTGAFRKDSPTPIGIRQPGRTNPNVSKRTHWERLCPTTGKW